MVFSVIGETHDKINDTQYLQECEQKKARHPTCMYLKT